MAIVMLGAAVPRMSAEHGGRPIGSFSTCDRPVSPSRCSSVGNNRLHLVFFDATLTEGLASSLRDTMAEDYDPTTLTVIEQGRRTPLTDVIAFSENYGDNGAAGWVYCPPGAPQGINPSGHRWCQQQELYFNLHPRLAAFTEDDGSRDHIACHEFGHTLGLRHWGNPPVTSDDRTAATCMNADTPNGPPDLHEIDIDHIDAYHYTAPRRHSWQRLVDAGVTRDPMRPSTWAPVNVQLTELEHYASVAEITAAADAVVVGRVIAVEPGRVFGGATGHPMHYAAVTIRVTELIRGTLLDPRTVSLEVPLFGGPTSIDRLRASLLEHDGAFFLRDKGDGHHRLAVVNGAVLDDHGRAVIPAGESDFGAAVDGGAFRDAVSLIRAAAG